MSGVCKGEKNGAAKLTAEQVITIRRSAETYAVLAKAFGVSVQTICDIRKRRSWSHI